MMKAKMIRKALLISGLILAILTAFPVNPVQRVYPEAKQLIRAKESDVRGDIK